MTTVVRNIESLKTTVRELLKGMSIVKLNSNKLLPSAHSEDGDSSFRDVTSEFTRLFIQVCCLDVQLEHIWMRLLSQTLQLGAMSSNVTGYLSNVGATSASGIDTLLTLSCARLLNQIALRSGSHGFQLKQNV
ncbi:hypothetical protein KP509_19G047400 [Ceratopteris richardii]|uniref:Uncharacterized protein n=1 Tax=Ceratopteris richardii TaxID=49495 RepID=A0A8T2SNN2_CERRI|nr:hypothetical protein KP509_19G047400 [Ceratopteris richardii]